MTANLLAQLFGPKPTWQGPCVIVLNAPASAVPAGPDSLAQAGAKVYAPRVVSGRVQADAVCYLPEQQALAITTTLRIRHASGDEVSRTSSLIVDASHVAAVEYAGLDVLKKLGLPAPPQAAEPVAK